MDFELNLDLDLMNCTLKELEEIVRNKPEFSVDNNL